MRRIPTLALLMLTLALGACGTRGPLYLPPVQKKPDSAPATAAAKPAASTASTPGTPAADSNTAP